MNMAAQLTPEHRMVPLEQLYLSDENPRQILPEEEVEAMAASLALYGLVQNLIGLEDEDGRIGIVGGGKRLRGLQRLAEEGWSRYHDMVPIDPVAVRVTSDRQIATAWAGAENNARSDLHPADEVRAYATMHAQGSSASMIARTFAKSEQHVARRLKLAALPDAALQALRAGELTIEQARALTLAVDDDRCLAALESVRGRDISAHQIRQELMERAVRADDRRALFVGQQAYTSAGGAIERDLFNDNTWWRDGDLVERLFQEKGEAQAEAFRHAEGWKWAEFRTEASLPYAAYAGLERLRPEPQDLDDADARSHERLLEADPEALSDEDADRLRRFNDWIEGIYADEDLETGGMFLMVNMLGRIELARGFRRTEDQPREEVEEDDQVERIASQPESEQPVFPQDLLHDLSGIRLAGIQTALLEQHELLLDLLAFTMLPDVKPWDAPLAVRIEQTHNTPERKQGFELPERLDPQATTWTEDAAAAFEAFRKQGRKHRNQILTSGLARSFRTPQSPLTEALAQMIDIQVRRVWTPTAEAFFKRVRTDYLDTLWDKLLELEEGDDRQARFRKLKKGEKAKELEALFSDMSVRETLGLSREQNARIDAWLPGELRFVSEAADG